MAKDALDVAREFVPRILADCQVHLTPSLQTDMELELARLLDENNGAADIEKIRVRLNSAYDELSDAKDDARDEEYRADELERKLKKSQALVEKLRTEPTENQLALLAHQEKGA